MNEQVSMINFFIGLFTYIFVGFILYYVVEPYLRLRKGIVFGGKDKVDQEFNRLFSGIFWPLWIPGYPLWIFILSPLCKFLVKLHDKAEEFWEPKIPESVEPSINASKSDYRNISYK